jgi:hypothetical protein
MLESSNNSLGCIVAGGASKKRNLTPESSIIASVFTTVGCGLLSTLKPSTHIEIKQYGYQTVLGFGLGLLYTALTMMMNIVVKRDDLGKSVCSPLQPQASDCD